MLFCMNTAKGSLDTLAIMSLGTTYPVLAEKHIRTFNTDRQPPDITPKRRCKNELCAHH